MNKLTPEQKRVMLKHTSIRRRLSGFSPVMSIGVQTFTLQEGTREYARFARRMLAVALTNLMHNKEFKK